MAPIAQYAPRLGKEGIGIGHVLEDVHGHHRIEGVVRNRPAISFHFLGRDLDLGVRVDWFRPDLDSGTRLVHDDRVFLAPDVPMRTKYLYVLGLTICLFFFAAIRHSMGTRRA